MEMKLWEDWDTSVSILAIVVQVVQEVLLPVRKRSSASLCNFNHCTYPQVCCS